VACRHFSKRRPWAFHFLGSETLEAGQMYKGGRGDARVSDTLDVALLNAAPKDTRTDQ
jgi:hypothetical protein